MINIEPYLQKLEWLKQYMRLKIDDGFPKNPGLYDLFPSFDEFMLYAEYAYRPKINMGFSKIYPYGGKM